MAIEGSWTIDDDERICSSVRVGSRLVLPPPCQVWFKHDGRYFLSDSDSDRWAKVLMRSVEK